MRASVSTRSRTASVVRATSVAVSGGVLALGLVACGGGSSTSASGSTSGATPTTRPTGAPGSRFGGQDFAKIQSCLTAAGITLPTGRARPSGSFTRPSGGFNGTPPSGGYGYGGGTPPSGAAGTPGTGQRRGGFGGGQGLFASAKVKAALKACGITVPTGGARPNGTASAPAA